MNTGPGNLGCVPYMGLIGLNHETTLAGGPKASGLVRALVAKKQDDRELLAGLEMGTC